MSIKHVLLVDDSKSARFALSKMLKNLGLEVSTADSGEDALKYLAEQQAEAIFLDHTMPGMDGFETAQAIKANPAWKHIPIVMCTGKTDEMPDYADHAKAVGASGVISKQPSPDSVQAILADLEKAQPPAVVAEEKVAVVAPAGLDRAAVESLVREMLDAAVEQRLPAIVNTVIEAQLPQLQSRLSAALESTITAAKADAVAQASEQGRRVAEQTAQSVVSQRIETEVRSIAMAEAKQAVRFAEQGQTEQLQAVVATVSELQQQVQSLQSRVTERAEQVAKTVIAAEIAPQVTALSTQLQEELNAVGERLRQGSTLTQDMKLAIEQAAEAVNTAATKELAATLEKQIEEHMQGTVQRTVATQLEEKLSAAGGESSQLPLIVGGIGAFLGLVAIILAVVM